jgi:hypothetical protein
VSLYASELQSKGLIRYRRGSLAIVDRGGLNNTACPCRSYMVSLRKKLGFEVVDPVAPPPPP